jgi:hypothetical protein
MQRYLGGEHLAHKDTPVRPIHNIANVATSAEACAIESQHLIVPSPLAELDHPGEENPSAFVDPISLTPFNYLGRHFVPHILSYLLARDQLYFTCATGTHPLLFLWHHGGESLCAFNCCMRSLSQHPIFFPLVHELDLSGLGVIFHRALWDLQAAQ